MAAARRLAVCTIRLPFNSGDFEATGLISTAKSTPHDGRPETQIIWIETSSAAAADALDLSAVSDGGALGFAGPEVRATAAEVLAKASNAIIMINFRMMGLPSPWSEGFNACRPLKVPQRGRRRLSPQLSPDG